MLNIIENQGDVLESDAEIICHQTNCLGVMGAGIALQIKNKYPLVYKKYKHYCERLGKNDAFGTAQFCKIDDSRYICNLFGQMHCNAYERQTDYEALNNAVKEMLTKIKCNNVLVKKIAIPKLLGCGLAGGDWNIVKEIFVSRLKEYCDENKIDITLEITEYDK